jgi:hypothetical protein
LTVDPPPSIQVRIADVPPLAAPGTAFVFGRVVTFIAILARVA